VPSTDPVRHLVLRDDGGDLSDQVLHVHWQDYILQPSPSYAEASRRLSEVTANITELKSRGLKVVWTIHNRMPHDVKYYFHEIEVCQYLADNADVIHVLSEQTLVAVRDLFEIDPAKVVVVEHGSYVGVYPELLDRATARARLGLLPSERVVLFFGGLRPYKGLEQLIESFDRVHRDDPTTRLLIVGQPGHAMDKSFLRFIEGLPFVTTRIGFVPESDVHVYFRAADVQVAPYTAVLNSGSVLLGLGYGLPIVAPRLGALESLAGEPFMFSYRAGSDSEFDTALRSAIAQAGDPSVAERATAFAAAYTGEDMSDTFVRDVLGRLFQTHGAPGRSLSRSG
jgi:glycosyltransferase involved in cell wall biosynthesis